MAIEKTLVFIDAGYLSKISKFFGNGKHLKLNLVRFSLYLAEKQGLECAHIFYYTAPPFQGEPPTLLESQLRAGYDSFTEKLSQDSRITIREGRLQKIGSTFTQKGVDTLLTMDLCEETVSRKINTIILLAADTDFVPVLNHLRANKGIKVILYYFTDRVRGSLFSMSNHLLTACSTSRMLQIEDFLKNQVNREK